MKDTTKHQGLRNQLANQLQIKGINDEKVLNAIRKIPRHLFIDSSFEAHAYQDKAFPIAAEQTISHPYTVAFQSEVLAINENLKEQKEEVEQTNESAKRTSRYCTRCI